MFLKKSIKCFFGDLTFKNDSNYRSGTIQKRVKEFNELMKKSNVLLSMIGGLILHQF